jgi:hypothetical protein
MCRVPLSLILVALGLWTHRSSAQGTYRRADIDSTGQLRLVLSTNRIIRPPRDSDQVGMEQPALSADHRIAGWLGLYTNCCTSYPIPLRLELRRIDGKRTSVSNELPIWRWAFSADGRSVVIRQAPVHGSAPEHYELRDVDNGRVIATADFDPTHAAALSEWARIAMPRQPAPPPSSSERRSLRAIY